METPNTYGHVNGLSIYERPSPDFHPFDVVRERFKVMVSNFEPFRRKLVEVPLGLDRPYWVDDAEFDLDYHVRHIGLAPPGAADQLAEQVARIVGRRMDRSRPLWEAYVIEGLADGRWALLQKTHHATIDGASGVIALMMFADDGPDGEWHYTEQPWTGEHPPGQGELLNKALGNLVMNPVRGTRLGLKLVRDVADAAGVRSVSDAAQRARSLLGTVGRRTDPNAPAESSEPGVNIPLSPAPPTPWNKSVGPHRRFAMRGSSLANLKVLKNATGGTLNDVVMAICTGALTWAADASGAGVLVCMASDSASLAVGAVATVAANAHVNVANPTAHATGRRPRNAAIMLERRRALPHTFLFVTTHYST